EKQEIQRNTSENSVVLTPATKDTPGAVQVVPVKDYIALKGEANLEGKQILAVVPESSARNKNDKDSSKNNKSSLTPEADYFVVLPEGQELSATELEKVEGEAAWYVPGLVGAATGAGWQGIQCWQGWTSRCSASDYAVAAGAGAVSAYTPAKYGIVGRFVVNQGIKWVFWR
ncbi:MAG: hypothetical protein ACKO2Z_31720, partial [Sphaerospermopsis kisseleviana]